MPRDRGSPRFFLFFWAGCFPPKRGAFFSRGHWGWLKDTWGWLKPKLWSLQEDDFRIHGFVVGAPLSYLLFRRERTPCRFFTLTILLVLQVWNYKINAYRYMGYLKMGEHKWMGVLLVCSEITSQRASGNNSMEVSLRTRVALARC